MSGTKILVVDDNATNRMLMITLLNSWGCRYETAGDGETALALLREAAEQNDPFRVALLDQLMPGMDVTRHTVAESARCGVRILLAEDNAINQKVAQAQLCRVLHERLEGTIVAC